METILATQQLTKRFGRLCAVNQLNLEVRKGEVFGLLGPNGSGKTTTLGMLMGVVNPTSGSFEWFGEEPLHTQRRRIGAVLEHPIFYPYLTGQRNLEVAAMIKGASPDRIGDVLELVELLPRRHDKFKTYSLGMKQRLAIASSLLNNPEVLILDEPTNGLDPMGIAEIRQIIRKIAANGQTIILASHLLDEVQKVCTHFAVMRKGDMIFSGSVDEVGRGEEQVEVIAYHDDLSMVLGEFPGTALIHKDGDRWVVKMKDGFHSQELNRYLFDRGVVASHLQTQKKSLEKEFLDILLKNSANNPANVIK